VCTASDNEPSPNRSRPTHIIITHIPPLFTHSLLCHITAVKRYGRFMCAQKLTLWPASSSATEGIIQSSITARYAMRPFVKILRPPATTMTSVQSSLAKDHIAAFYLLIPQNGWHTFPQKCPQLQGIWTPIKCMVPWTHSSQNGTSNGSAIFAQLTHVPNTLTGFGYPGRYPKISPIGGLTVDSSQLTLVPTSVT